jgi:hypothetical protein
VFTLHWQFASSALRILPTLDSVELCSRKSRRVFSSFPFVFLSTYLRAFYENSCGGQFSQKDVIFGSLLAVFGGSAKIAHFCHFCVYNAICMIPEVRLVKAEDGAFG